MAARFLPDQRLAFMDARPGSMCACNMSKDKWALYTGVLYYIGRVFTWENIPLPFRSGRYSLQSKYAGRNVLRRCLHRCRDKISSL